jgi:hypothetical protein
MIYNWVTFDSPFTVSYQGHLPHFQGQGALGVYNLKAPQFEEMLRALIGDRGLLVLTPIMALAVWGCYLAIRERLPTRRDAIIAIIMLVLMLPISAGVDGYGGGAPGPRYLITVFPFFAIPLALAWSRAPRLCVAATTVGVFFMVLATITDPIPSSAVPFAPELWFRRLVDGRLAPSIPGDVLNKWLVLTTAAAGLGALGYALALDRRAVPDGNETARPEG